MLYIKLLFYIILTILNNIYITFLENYDNILLNYHSFLKKIYKYYLQFLVYYSIL